ncbi:MAG TPA: dihydrofolate reductase [Rickettsia endosymbiont of Pyrocoelia pectoralis]|nr:dihydrofolate reductase [Rickettsia endosymbiont of Pyrocoelia pectoralis]
MNNRKIIGIMACDPLGVMGNKGQIPWSYSNEFEYFYQKVANNVIVIGRKTFDHIPAKILKNCICIVFSRKIPSQFCNNIFFIKSLDDFWQVIKPFTDKEIFMIGGAEVATFFLKQNLIDEFLLTRINKNYDGDTFFPLNLLAKWHSATIDKASDYQIYKFIKNEVI